MKTPTIISILILFLNCFYLSAQEENQPEKSSAVEKLFDSEEMMPMKFSYSIKELKKNTNDSVYMDSKVSYYSDGEWHEIDALIRTRGQYRLENCYYPPIKLKIKKSVSKGTIFEGHKSFKVVIPCLIQKDNSDNVIKEYMAYKIYETLSPYYFETRLVNIEFEEVRNRKSKIHQLKGFLVEDDSHVAKRLDGNVYKRKAHPLQQEASCSVRNCMFQFMIGNTDYSQAYQHNVKLLFIDKRIVPVPYDFDMAGLVNTSYAVVSQIQDQKLPISSVRDRMYRGFERDPEVFYQIRDEYRSKKLDILAEVEKTKPYFDNIREYEVARDYVMEFYRIIENDKRFRNEVIDMARED